MMSTSYQTAALTHGDGGLALSRPCKGASARNLAPCERLPSILGTHEYVRDRTKCAQRRASSQRLSGSSVPSPGYRSQHRRVHGGHRDVHPRCARTSRRTQMEPDALLAPLRGLIFAAPACGARGTELL